MDSSNEKIYNVLLLSFSFMLVFTGFQTCGMVEQTVLNSYINDTKDINGQPTYHGDGYTSLAIIYTVFAFSNWLAPSIVSIIGSKYSMMIGAVAYVLYLATFIKPLTWTLYLGSVLIGIGGAILWTGQGVFLTNNSSSNTMGRNSGIFWAILQSSFLIGNMYVFFAWQGITNIGDSQRIPLYIGLTAISAFGVICMAFLKSKNNTESVEEEPAITENIEVNNENEEKPLIEQNEKSSRTQEAYIAFKKSLCLLRTKNMILLSVTFFYTGLELTFFSGVYSTSVGATKQFGSDSDRLVGLVGIMIGIGEIVGGLTFGIFGKKTVKYGRDPIILMGGVLHFVAYFLIFLNLPSDAPTAKDGTMSTGYITPISELAIACGFLLGFCDACYNTQCISIIGVTYPDNSAAAFAVFKFVQCLAAAVGFFYSSYLQLQYQLLILVLFNFAGMLTFIIVETKLKHENKVLSNHHDVPE